jgi:hypothetical protein
MEGVVTGGIMPFDFEWSNGETTPIITNLQTDLYCLTVTDVNSCAFQLCESITTPMALTIETTNAKCGSNGGTANVSVTGGALPYDFEWSNGETNDTIFNLAPGTYEATVTSENGCTETRDGVVELDTGSYDIDLEIINPGCSGNSTGSISASATGGVSPYLFIWSTGDTAVSVDNLPVGTYYVTATDSYGCEQIDSATLVTGTSIDLFMESSDPFCNGSMNGRAVASPTNGTPPFLYLWSNGDTTQAISGLGAGTYYVFVIDSLDCLASDSVVLTDPPVFNAQIISTNISECGEEDGTAMVTASGGGNAPFSYLWNTGDTINSLTNLATGFYSVTITSVQGCQAKDSITITSPDTLDVFIDGIVEICPNTSNGELTAHANNGSAPYNYVWSNGGATQTINNLPAGTYTVTVTSQEGCMGTATATIITTSITLDVSIDGTDVICWNANNGELTAVANTGTAPFDYTWSNGETAQTINNLSPGNYAVTVTGNDGCTGTASSAITENAPLTVSSSVVNIPCFGLSNGAINLNIGGGTFPLNILWDNGSNSTIRNNLAAGDYSFTVTDAIGCSISDTITITQPDPLSLSFNSSAGSCGDNGFTIAIVIGGTAPYKYLWSTGATTSFIDNLAPGNYSVTVTDDKNCTKTATANIVPYPAINLNVTATNTTCNGTTNGTATANATGGTAPFTYSWSNGGTTKTISGLTFGTYSVTVTDATDCTATGSATVMLGSGLTVTIDGPEYICPGEVGSITANAIGGAANYDFIWSDGQITQTASNLTPGTYSVTVTDPSGCSGEASMTLLEGGKFSVNSTFQNIGCFGETTGRIDLIVQNGLPPYVYSWSNGSNTSSIQNLPAGNYSVTVSDQSNCTKTYDIVISQPPKLEVEVNGVNGVCGNLGSATSMVAGGTSPYFYLWSNGNTNPSINVLLPNTYFLTVTDAKGCKAVDSTTIELIPFVSCNVMLMHPVTSINGSDGELMAMANDGTAPYQFLWSNGQTTQVISNLTTGNYGVTVTDANNCMTTCSFILMDGARIGDFVWEDANENGIQDAGELGIENVTIGLEGVDGYGNMVSTTTNTDPLGKYFFDVIPGNYQLTFNVPTGFLPSPNAQGADASLDSDPDPLTNQTSTFSISAGVNNTNIDAGFYVEINCDNVTDAGEICCDQAVCAPGDQPALFTELTAPIGGSGNLEFVWMFSDQTAIFDPMTWDVVPNANNADLLPTPLSSTTYFIRRVRRSGCSQFFQSNVVEVFVNDFPTPEIMGTDTVCVNTPASFTTTDYGPNALYDWSFEGANPDTSSSLSVNNIFWGFTGTKDISISVNIDGCPLFATAKVRVTDHPDTCGYDLVLKGKLTDTMTVLLDWLYPESNNILRTYLVEYSLDNNTFTSLGPPDSTAQATGLVHYFHTHRTPVVGANYYRVILSDSQGQKLTSNVVEITKDSVPPEPEGDYYLVHSYPNPFKDKITVDVYDWFEDLPIIVELINTLGQITYFAEIPTGTARFEIETADFASGTYFLFVRYDGKPQKIFKLVK